MAAVAVVSTVVEAASTAVAATDSGYLLTEAAKRN
jgi:hypothetical protein